MSRNMKRRFITNTRLCVLSEFDDIFDRNPVTCLEEGEIRCFVLPEHIFVYNIYPYVKKTTRMTFYNKFRYVYVCVITR